MSYTGKIIDLSKYGKYGKEVELSKIEVQLTYLTQISKAVAEAKKQYEKAHANAKKVDELHKQVQKDNQKIYDDLEVLRKKMFELIQDAYDQAADLGINLPKDFNNGYDELTGYIDKVPLSKLGHVFPV